MRCPVDKSDMIVVEHQKIELDYCLKCAGVWLDSGELDLLVFCFEGRRSQFDPMLRFSAQRAAQVSESKRKCPICRRNMDKVWIGKAPKS